MPIYDFTPEPQVGGFPDQGVAEIRPDKNGNSALLQSSDAEQGRTKFLGDSDGKHPDYYQEFLIPGFRTLDEGVKNYFSGMLIPTKDSYRSMNVKIAGGDKSLMVWRDSLSDGRVVLPVCSVNRTGHEFDKDKFSPPYMSMSKKYINGRMDRVALVKRPVSYLVKYELIVWTESKRDAEYINYQILTRFNPLAQFKMSDDHISGCVVLHLDGATDASEKEASADKKAKTRYEYSISAEAWLPLPEIIVPTILGHSTSVRESTTSAAIAQSMGSISII